MQRSKILAITIIAIFMFQVFSANNSVLEDKTTENVQPLNAQKHNSQVFPANNTVLEDKTTENVQPLNAQKHNSQVFSAYNIDSSTWYQGETVRVDTQAALKIPEKGDVQDINNNIDSVHWTNYDTDYMAADDGSRAKIYVKSKQPHPITMYGTWDFYIDVPIIVPGKIYIKNAKIYRTNIDPTDDIFNIKILSNTGSTVTLPLNDVQQNFTIDITNAELFGNRILGIFEFVADSYSTSSFYEYGIDVDQFIFVADPITTQIQSSYQYSSKNTLIHKLSIENFDYGTQINLYNPLSWNFTTINPIATPNWDSVNKYYSISNTIPTTYEIQFVSGEGFGVDYPRQEQILAIEDVSSDYLNCEGFECGSVEDWVTPAGEFDLSVSTSVVSSGTFSLKIDDGVAVDSLYNENSLLDDGTYYISFDIYIESPSATSFQFYNYNAGWEYYSIDQTITNRWQKVFLFVQIRGDSSGRNLAFEESGNGLIAFIDNFHIFKPSGEVVNVGYNEYEFSSQFISWDGYQNPLLDNIEVEWQLRDRTANEEIISKTLTTNSLGIASYIFSGSLEQKEYENRWYSLENTFLSWAQSDVWDIDNWKDYDDYIENTDNILLKDASGNPDFDMSETWDLSNSDFLYIDFEMNITATHIFYLYENSANYYRYQKYALANTRTLFEVELNNYDSFNGNPVFSSIDYIGTVWTTTPHELTIYDLRVIHAQKTYFTPSSDLSYCYKNSENKNYWDFSEKTNYYAWTDYNKFDDGTLIISPAANRYYLYFDIDKLSIDTSFYNIFSIRVKTNASDISSLRVRTQINLLTSVGDMSFISTDWQTLKMNMSLSSAWVGTATSFRILLENANATLLDDSVFFWIDLISISHRTHENGYNYEFKEPEIISTYAESNLNGWDLKQTGSSTIYVQNNYLHAEYSSPFRGIRKWFETDLSEVSQKYIEFYAKSDNSSKIDILIYSGTAGSFGSYVSSPKSNLILTSTWTKYRYQIDAGSGSWNLLFEGDESSGEFDIEYIRIVDTSVNLYETANSFFFSSENDTSTYYYELDCYSGYVTDLEYVPQDMSVGTHSFSYTHIYDASIDENLLQLSSIWYSYDYTIAESDLSTISIIDQQGQYVDIRQYRVETNSQRIYGDTFYVSDISATFNLTISDFWGNILYQDTAQSYSRFIDIVLTLYSVKIYNEMQNPVFVELSNGPTFSTWLLPGEIYEFKLRSDSYTFTLQYSNSISGFSAATLNGTTTQYIYTVTADTALLISAFSIADVFANVVSLANTLDSTNSSIHAALASQTNNITIAIDNTNTNIDSQTNNIIISIDNTNSTLGSQLNLLELSISNMNSTIYSQTLSILSSISNLDSVVMSQTIEILNSVSNMNSTIYSQTVSILSDIENANSTLYVQTLDLLTQIDLSNSTQVSLILNNYAAILEAQEAAAEYMSELRVETYVPALSDSSVSYVLSTNWKNATVHVLLDGTSVLNTTEGSFVISNLAPGSWNITIIISSAPWVLSNSNIFVIAVPPETASLLHFRFSNEAGVGLDWNIAKLVVNGTTLYSSERYFSPGVFLNISVFSWAGSLLLQTNYTVLFEESELVFMLPIFTVEFVNEYDFDMLVNMTTTVSNTSLTFIVPKDSSYLMASFEGTFQITTSPINPETVRNGTYELSYSAYTQSLDIYKGLKRITLSTEITARKLSQIEQQTDQVTRILLAIFGVTGAFSILIAVLIWALRGYFANIAKENLIEPLGRRGLESTSNYTIEDDETIYKKGSRPNGTSDQLNNFLNGKL